MAVYFPDNSANLTRSATYLSRTSSWTRFIWCRNGSTTPIGGAPYRNYVSDGDTTFATSYVYLGSGPGVNVNTVVAEIFDGTTVTDSATFSPTANVWFWLGLVYDSVGHTLKFYANGTLVGTITVNFSTFTFGTQLQEAGTAVGSLGDDAVGYIREWQQTLTLAQLTAEAASPVAVVLANLLTDTALAYPGDLTDISGNGHPWTLAGVPTEVAGPVLPAVVSVSANVPQWTTNPQLVIPGATNLTAVAPNTTAWADSLWVPLIAATDVAWIITGLLLQPDTLASFKVGFEADLGVGPPGSEVPITTFRGYYGRTFYVSPGVIPHIPPLNNIPGGSRLSVRFRKGNTTASTWAFGVTYLAQPFTGSLLTTAKPQKCAPSRADNLAFAVNAAAWGNSAWVPFIASTANAIVLVGIIPVISNLGSDAEFEVGIGALGAESPITRARINNTSGATGDIDGPTIWPFYDPVDAIPAATRVSMRTRLAQPTSRTASAALVYIEKPL